MSLRHAARNAILLVALLALAAVAAPRLSPWPSVLLIRHDYDDAAKKRVAALSKHVPGDVRAILDEPYAPGETNLTLDVFRPSAPEGVARTTVVWLHGGAWVSGDKADVAPWLRVLASRGFTVVGVNYSLAPGRRHPVPVREVNAALAHLVRGAERFEVDPTRIVLAGDTGGAHIAAELANAICVRSFALTLGIEPAMRPAHLAGTALFSGAYDMGTLDLAGESGRFLQTVLWAYSGSRDFQGDAAFAPATIAPHLTPDFPPTFLTAGPADPLAPQSQAFASALADQGVPVDSLFFPAERAPGPLREGLFDLDSPRGREALERLVAFLEALPAR